MADNRPIGVFDSGVGGLTVVREIKKLMPNENIVYFGDTGRVPYGSKSNETIIRYAKEDESFLLKRNVKIIVAACGTVSSVAASTAKELPIPFFDVVSPAAVAAVEATKTGRIGIIGTSATIKSGAHKSNILKLLPTAEIFAKACPLFVPLVEEGWIERDNPVTRETALRYLKEIKENGVDTLILGCTHYPALVDVIGDIMGDKVTLINMGTSVAKNVKTTLEKLNAFSSNFTGDKYFVSDRVESFSVLAKRLLGTDIGDIVEKIDI